MKNWRLHREKLLKDHEWSEFKKYLEGKLVVKQTWTAMQDYAICMMAVWTGLRRSELANLKIDDIFLGPTPFIVVRNGKGAKYREVLISEDCKSFLIRFIANCPRKSRYLFIPQRGEKYTGDGIYRVWKTAIEDSQVTYRSIHKARHYNGTKLHEVTKDLRFVQEQLGHSRITTTEIYTHITEEKSKGYLANFDKVI